METPTQTDPALYVPDEPGVFWCARHRKVKTRLRCGRCEAPICPKCTVMGPTGARCRDCASNRSAHIYQISPLQFFLSFAASVAIGAVGSVLVALAGMLILFALFYAPAAGPMLGKIISKITGGKRGPVLASVVSVGLVCGAALTYIGEAYAMWSMSERSRALVPPDMAAKMPHSSFVEYLFINPLGLVFVVVFLVVAIGGAWWWLK